MSVPDSYFKNMDRKTIIANYRNLVERLNQQPDTDVWYMGFINEVFDLLENLEGSELEKELKQLYKDKYKIGETQ